MGKVVGDRWALSRRWRVVRTLAIAGLSLALAPTVSSTPGPRQHQSYEALVRQDYQGDADAAVLALVKVPARQVEDALSSMESIPKDGSTAAAAVMLHTEAALRGGDRDSNLKAARSALARLPSGVDAAGFVRGWRIVVASWLLANNLPDEADRLAQSGDTHEETLLLQGAVAEAMATAAASKPGAAFVNVNRARNRNRVALLTEAEEKYRAALARNPGLVEAAVRLGRLLAREGDRDAALDVLTAARSKAGEGFLAYMAALFTGDLHERAGRIEAARECYQSAVDVYPEAQTARVALAHLLENSGHPLEGWAEICALFEDRHASGRDPWWVYPHAQDWQTNQRLAELRAFAWRPR